MTALRRTRPSPVVWCIAVAAVALGIAAAVLFTGSSTGAQAAKGQTVVVVEHNPTWGTILALSNGDTVYRFAKDAADESKCSGTCADVWPPVMLAAGQRTPIGRGVGHLGTIARGAREQVTYEGIPLYRFVGDSRPGAVTGNITDTFGPWWVVRPADPLATPQPSSPPTASNGTGTTSTTSGGAGRGTAVPRSTGLSSGTQAVTPGASSPGPGTPDTTQPQSTPTTAGSPAPTTEPKPTTTTTTEPKPTTTTTTTTPSGGGVSY